MSGRKKIDTRLPANSMGPRELSNVNVRPTLERSRTVVLTPPALVVPTDGRELGRGVRTSNMVKSLPTKEETDEVLPPVLSVTLTANAAGGADEANSTTRRRSEQWRMRCGPFPEETGSR